VFSDNLVFHPSSYKQAPCVPTLPNLLPAVTQRNDLDISAGLDFTRILVKFGFIGVHDHFSVTY
jgi:hypothetical protein